MNQSGIMEKGLAACEEMMSSVSILDDSSSNNNNDPLVCPKPRRPAPVNSAAVIDSMAGIELLDIILFKGGYGTEHSNYFNSPPPFFRGSPPSRASNPLVEDAHFRDRKLTPSSPLSVPPALSLSSSPSSLTRKGSCARPKFGQTSATIRIEGFDCLNRDRRNCSVPAVA